MTQTKQPVPKRPGATIQGVEVDAEQLDWLLDQIHGTKQTVQDVIARLVPRK